MKRKQIGIIELKSTIFKSNNWMDGSIYLHRELVNLKIRKELSRMKHREKKYIEKYKNGSETD